MKNRIRELLFIACLCFTAFSLGAQDGEAVFKKTCSACHTVGGGRLVGPDLIGVTNKRSEDWLIQFIKSSQTLIKSGDADAKAIFEEYNQIMMPDQNVSDAEIKSILAFIASKSPAAANEETAAKEEVAIEEVKEETPKKEVTPLDIEEGMALFTGSTSFENGGPSCLSCHNVDNDNIVGGGLLAKDLTNVYQRIGEAGIQGILNAPPFPAMADSYKERELTEDEIFKLTAFLKHADEEALYQHHRNYNSVFVFGGGFGLFGLLIIIFIVWFNRKQKSVKESIFKRQIKSI